MRKREGEKHQCVGASQVPPTGNLARNPDMCPDWESNQQPFGLQASTQSTELHQSGLIVNIIWVLRHVRHVSRENEQCSS